MPSRKARISSDFLTLLYASSKVNFENDTMRNRISDDFDFLNQKPKKQISHE